jgi:hypothetical protein
MSVSRARWLTTLSPRAQVKQLFILCMMRTAEPIAFTVIFPFIANVSVPACEPGWAGVQRSR